MKPVAPVTRAVRTWGLIKVGYTRFGDHSLEVEGDFSPRAAVSRAHGYRDGGRRIGSGAASAFA